MTKLDFISLCGTLLIDVDVALENDEVKEGLRNKISLSDMQDILMENF